MTKSSRGFAALELVLVAAVLALVGLLAYRVYFQPKAVTTNVSQPASTAEIKSTSDLDTAEKQMDNEQLDAKTDDESKLDAELAAF
ncbi:MAG TPA: hypothetical protein VLF41_02425 [Candidatus Nanoarchaeia archaeon]|nr:hypothetical protein [Candidatus Nanoarchaeia archaeon]